MPGPDYQDHGGLHSTGEPGMYMDDHGVPYISLRRLVGLPESDSESDEDMSLPDLVDRDHDSSRGDPPDDTLPIKSRIGTGRVIPSKFNPPSDMNTPQLLFPSGYGEKAIPIVHRFIHREDPSQVLIYTDGACLDNGNAGAKGGCAFVFRPSMPGSSGHCSFALEKKGPTGEEHQQTSNRAELRAAIGALQFRVWDGEGFKTMVIATDSEYLVNGITEWVQGWLRRGWRTRVGQPVKNKDLWQTLLGEAERWSDRGVKLKFWHIPRNLNTEADRWAKDAAANKSTLDEFCKISGVLV